MKIANGTKTDSSAPELIVMRVQDEEGSCFQNWMYCKNKVETLCTGGRIGAPTNGVGISLEELLKKYMVGYDENNMSGNILVDKLEKDI